jgi:arsenate reductase (thioredoxin)
MKILILCTGNSCRSQMAEAWLRSFDPSLEVFSAGVAPEKMVNPYAVRAMKEAGIDISQKKAKDVSLFTAEPFDYVITVCDNAREACPVFNGRVRHRLHNSFEDPAGAVGTDDQVMAVYRRVRDQIKDWFREFYIRLEHNA